MWTALVGRFFQLLRNAYGGQRVNLCSPLLIRINHFSLLGNFSPTLPLAPFAGYRFIYFLCRQKVSKKLVAQCVIKVRLKRVFLQLALLAQTSKNTFPFKPPFKGDAKGRQEQQKPLLLSNKVILEGFCPVSVVSLFYNNRFPTTPLGNDTAPFVVCRCYFPSTLKNP